LRALARRKGRNGQRTTERNKKERTGGLAESPMFSRAVKGGGGQNPGRYGDYGGKEKWLLGNDLC